MGKHQLPYHQSLMNGLNDFIFKESIKNLRIEFFELHNDSILEAAYLDK